MVVMMVVIMIRVPMVVMMVACDDGSLQYVQPPPSPCTGSRQQMSANLVASVCLWSSGVVYL